MNRETGVAKTSQDAPSAGFNASAPSGFRKSISMPFGATIICFKVSSQDIPSCCKLLAGSVGALKGSSRVHVILNVVLKSQAERRS